MSDTEKLLAEIATRLLVAHVEKHGLSSDRAYANRALAYADIIVSGTGLKGQHNDK